MPKGEGNTGRNKKHSRRVVKKTRRKRKRSVLRASAMTDFVTTYFKKIQLRFKQACRRFHRKRSRGFWHRLFSFESKSYKNQRSSTPLHTKEQNYKDLIARLRMAAHMAKASKNAQWDAGSLIHNRSDLPLCCRFSSKCQILRYKITQIIKRFGLFAKLALLALHVLIRHVCLRIDRMWIRSLQGMHRCWRLVFERIKSSCYGFQSICKHSLYFVKKCAIVLRTFIAQCLQKIRRNTIRTAMQLKNDTALQLNKYILHVRCKANSFFYLLQKKCWHIPLFKIQRAQFHLKRMTRHAVRAVKRFQHDAQFKMKRAWCLLQRVLYTSMRAIPGLAQRMQCRLHRIWLRTLRILKLAAHMCWYAPLFKIQRAQLRFKRMTRHAMRAVKHLQHDAQFKMKRAWRLVQRVRYTSMRAIQGLAQRMQCRLRWYFHRIWLRTLRILKLVPHIGWYVPVFKIQRAQLRFKRMRSHIMRVVKRCQHYESFQIRHFLYRFKMKRVGLLSFIFQRWKISVLKIRRTRRNIQVTLKQLRLSLQGLNKIHIRSWNWQKWIQQIPRSREIVLTCLLIVLFLPVLFFKAMRNSFYSLITQNAMQDLIHPSEPFVFRDSLLCFNESLHPSLDRSLDASSADIDKNSWLTPNTAAQNMVPMLVKQNRISSFLSNTPLAAAPDLFSSNSVQEDKTYPFDAGKKEWAPQRVFLRNVQETDDGFGNVRNYWTLDALVAPLFKPGHILPLLDVRWHEFSDDRESNRFAANVGLMARYVPESHCAPLIGANLYYDYRHSTIGKGWNRWGAGMEILGKRWDFRLNGYFPIGGKLHMHKCTFDDFEGDFTMIQRKYEFMYTGFNADIGCRGIVTKNWQVYLTGGTYYLKGACHFSTWGFRMGLRPQFKDYIALDLSVSHDHIFHTVYQGQIIFSLPLYSFGSQKNKTGPCGISQRQIYQPVERFDIVPVSRVCCWDQNF